MLGRTSHVASRLEPKGVQGYVLWGLWIPGKGTGVLIELPKVSGTGMEVLQNSQKFRAGTKGAVPVPRLFVARGVQNSQQFRVQV